MKKRVMTKKAITAIADRRHRARPTSRNARLNETEAPNGAETTGAERPVRRRLPNPGEQFALLFADGRLHCSCACAYTVDSVSRIRRASGSDDLSEGLRKLLLGTLGWLSDWEAAAQNQPGPHATPPGQGVPKPQSRHLARALRAVAALLPAVAISTCEDRESKDRFWTSVAPLCCLGPYPGKCPAMRRNINRIFAHAAQKDGEVKAAGAGGPARV